MRQSVTINKMKEIFKTYFDHVRFIKIAGGRYQESGLPDLMIGIRHLFPYRQLGNNEIQKIFWLEIKSNWEDEPTKLQKWNVENLRQFGFITGYIVYDEYKYNWKDKEPQPIINLIFKIKGLS